MLMTHLKQIDYDLNGSATVHISVRKKETLETSIELAFEIPQIGSLDEAAEEARKELERYAQALLQASREELLLFANNTANKFG